MTHAARRLTLAGAAAALLAAAAAPAAVAAPPLCEADAQAAITCEGRMAGAGVAEKGGVRYGHAFALRCDGETRSANLVISWPGKVFKLDRITSTGCQDYGRRSGSRRSTDDGRLFGEGYGRLNGRSGYKIVFDAFDLGEPGKDVDRFDFQITKPNWQPEVRLTLKAGEHHFLGE